MKAPNCTKEESIRNSVRFADWVAYALDVLSGTNAGLFTIHLRTMFGLDRNKESEEMRLKIIKAQEQARTDIRSAIFAFAPELKKNKWLTTSTIFFTPEQKERILFRNSPEFLEDLENAPEVLIFADATEEFFRTTKESVLIAAESKRIRYYLETTEATSDVITFIIH